MYITNKEYKLGGCYIKLPIVLTDDLYEAAKIAGVKNFKILAQHPDCGNNEFEYSEFTKISHSEYELVKTYCRVLDAFVDFKNYEFLDKFVISKLSKIPNRGIDYNLFVIVNDAEYYLTVSDEIINILEFDISKSFGDNFEDYRFLLLELIKHEHHTTGVYEYDEEYPIEAMDINIFNCWKENSYKKLKNRNLGDLEICFERLLNYLFNKIKI
jgi:hypothetical protein